MNKPSKAAAVGAARRIRSHTKNCDCTDEEIGALIQRLAVSPAVAARDIEWCKMLGHPEAGAVGNTPEFMQRELDAMEDFDAADHVRCRNRLAAAEDALRKDLIAWAREEIRGEPVRWNWAIQNYNAGHDQALHKLIRRLEEG